MSAKDAGKAGFTGGKRVVYIRPVFSYGDTRLDEHSINGYAVTALNELMQQARDTGVYTDRSLAQAAFKVLDPDLRGKYPLPKTQDEDTNSGYFHSLLNLRCHSLTGE